MTNHSKLPTTGSRFPLKSPKKQKKERQKSHSRKQTHRSGHRFPSGQDTMIRIKTPDNRYNELWIHPRAVLTNDFPAWYTKAYKRDRSYFEVGQMVLVEKQGNHYTIVMPDYSMALDYVPKKCLRFIEIVQKEGSDNGKG